MPLLSIYRKEIKIYVQIKYYTESLYHNYIHNFQKLEIKQMSNNWEIYKKIMVYDTIEYSTIERNYLCQQQHSNSNIKHIKPRATS